MSRIKAKKSLDQLDNHQPCQILAFRRDIVETSNYWGVLQLGADVSEHRIGPIFKGQVLHACSLPTFRDTVSVQFLSVTFSMPVHYQCFGTPYRCHRQGSRYPRRNFFPFEHTDH
jgi:hypothetical protein